MLGSARPLREKTALFWHGHFATSAEKAYYGFHVVGRGVRYGSTGGMQHDSPIRGMKPAPDGNGYCLFADDGGVFTFGSCRFHGSLGGQGHRDVVSMG